MIITLAMIVRNEAHVLGRLFKSVRPHINNWLIIDTGSEDQTRALVSVMMQDIPGELLEREWVDFGHNREELVDIASSRGDYLLLLDGDDELVTYEPLPHITAAGYSLTILDGGPEYRQPRLISTRYEWRYVGTTHEYLTGPSCDNLDAWAVRHHCDGSRRPNKFVEDEKLLRAALRRNPRDARTIFYLANTLRDMGRYDEARFLYERRSGMGGWEAEAAAAAEAARRIRAGNYEPIGVPS